MARLHATSKPGTQQLPISFGARLYHSSTDCCHVGVLCGLNELLNESAEVGEHGEMHMQVHNALIMAFSIRHETETMYWSCSKRLCTAISLQDILLLLLCVFICSAISLRAIAIQCHRHRDRGAALFGKVVAPIIKTHPNEIINQPNDSMQMCARLLSRPSAQQFAHMRAALCWPIAST